MVTRIHAMAAAERRAGCAEGNLVVEVICVISTVRLPGGGGHPRGDGGDEAGVRGEGVRGENSGPCGESALAVAEGCRDAGAVQNAVGDCAAAIPPKRCTTRFAALGTGFLSTNRTRKDRLSVFYFYSVQSPGRRRANGGHLWESHGRAHSIKAVFPSLFKPPYRIAAKVNSSTISRSFLGPTPGRIFSRPQ